MTEKNDRLYAVIMAGGGGTRLWPLSRQLRPKQMLKLGSEKALFQIATERLEGLVPHHRILVVTVADMAGDLQKLCPEIPLENYLLEPAPRGTAAVVGMAAAYLRKRDPQAVMAVLTADHIIENVTYFQELLKNAVSVARQGYLVTLGIQPTLPSTAYGYIQRGELIAEIGAQKIYQVLRFKEKPNEETARKMIASGDHDWNSGMFIWQVETIWQAFQQWMPDLSTTLSEIERLWGAADHQSDIERLWLAIKPQTIDYGIMEHASRVAVLPAAGLGWSDVGSWDSLFEVLDADENGNIILADPFEAVDTKSTLVYSEDPQRLIAAIGIQDLIVIETEDVLLLCHRSKAQQVKNIVDKLKENNRQQYL